MFKRIAVIVIGLLMVLTMATPASASLPSKWCSTTGSDGFGMKATVTVIANHVGYRTVRVNWTAKSGILDGTHYYWESEHISKYSTNEYAAPGYAHPAYFTVHNGPAIVTMYWKQDRYWQKDWHASCWVKLPGAIS